VNATAVMDGPQTMRAVVARELSGPEALRLEEIALPEGAHPAADGKRMLVEVHATGVSFPDVLQTRGAYQFGSPPPYVTGGEVAGVVLEASPGCGFEPGDRVAGMTIWGGMAEYALALPEYTMPLPARMSFVEGAALHLNYTTAWLAVSRAQVRAGETVVVHGAAGGVGTAALELVKAAGARAIAVVSSEEKEAVARRMGADHVVRSTGPWLEEIRELTGGWGADVVLDPVGGDRFVDSVRALDVGGRLAVIGFTAGSIPEVRVNRLLLRGLSVVGVAMGPVERRFPGSARRAGQVVQGLAADGKIAPFIGARLPLEEGAEAVRMIDRREAVGKVVVEVRA
jgi:NADPH2:quinone reductase